MAPTASIRIGTRGSSLAIKQAETAVEALQRAAGQAGLELRPQIVTIKTTGDLVTDRPFTQIGEKGVFVADLQQALLDGSVDVAVHSLKDLEADHPPGLELAAVLERTEARDALVCHRARSLRNLPSGSRIGTSSVRRAAQIAAVRPDLHVVALRGNVDTRLEKVRRGEVDAAILAGAGLERLGRLDAVSEWLDPLVFVPAPGQGAIAIEAPTKAVSDQLTWVTAAEDPLTRAAVDAERTFMRAMEGGCRAPLGAWARFDDTDLVCDGFLSTTDGRDVLRGSVRGVGGAHVGSRLAEDLYERGAARLLSTLRAP